MKRLLAFTVIWLLVMVIIAGSALAVPPGQCNKVDPPGQENKCLEQGAPAGPHCDDIKSPTQRARCEAQAPGGG